MYKNIEVNVNEYLGKQKKNYYCHSQPEASTVPMVEIIHRILI